MKKKIITLKRIIKLNLRKIYMFLYQNIHKIDNNKIVFSSFNGKQYSDSGRAISEELYRRNPNLKLVWLLSENAIKDTYSIIPDYVIKIKNSNKQILKEISTAKVFISNEAFEKIYKNKNQMFIDTWHGDRAFKKILHEAYTNGQRPIRIYDDKVVDYCIAASDYGEERYRKAFKYNGTIIKQGMPRNDGLVNGNINKKELKKKIGLTNEKILLYAPTFRDNKKSELQKTDLDFDKILDILSKDGNDWKLIVRSHPSSSGLDIKVNQTNMIDLTYYPDMTDILNITDFLITDYSSSAMDFALTNKPIILFLYDYEEYKKKCRDFCADPKEVGFIYANNEEELLEIIKNTNEKEYKNACKKANDYYKINETGKSTKIICDYITDFIQRNIKR